MASLVTTTVTGTITVSSDGSFGGANETSATLFVRGGNADFWNSTNSLLRINHDGTRANLQSFTGGAYDDIAINPDGGSVGIGTNNPESLLHVAGDIKSKGDGKRILLESDDYLVAALTRQGTSGSAADQGGLELYNAGTAKVALFANTTSYINNGANFGIGTNAPESLLHLEGSIPTIILHDTDTTVSGDDYGKIQWHTKDASMPGTDDIGAEIKATDDSTFGDRAALLFSTAHNATSLTERMRIASNGNVGIGTNVPAALLHVGGAAASPHAAADDFVIAPAATDVGMTIRCNSNSGTGSIFFADTAANAQGLIRYNHNSDYMSFYSTGNFFFDGSSGADVLFRINTGSSEVDARLMLGEGANYGMTFEYDGVSNIGYLGMNDNVAPTASWSKRIQMSRAGTEVAFMAGRVGIGTATPDAKLHVHTASAGSVTAPTAADDLVIENSAACGITIISPDANDGGLYFANPSDSEAACLRWNHNADTLILETRNAGASLVFETANTVEAMRINSSGLVGIGTNNPVYTLQGNGTNGGIIGVTRTSGNTTGVLGHVRFGNTDIDSDLANIEGVQDGATDSARLEFQTQATGAAAATHMTIKSTGLIGIGTEDPGAALDVAKSSGNILRCKGDSFNTRFAVGASGACTIEANTGSYALDITNADSGKKGIKLADSVKTVWGDGDDLEIYHDGSHSYIKAHNTGDLYVTSENDDVVIRGADDVFIYTAGGEDAIAARGNGKVELYYDASSKLETNGSGVTITGTATATTFSGSGSSLTSLNGSNISSGTVAAARLGSGSSITTKFLRGDNTWQTVSGGGGSGTVTEVTVGTGLDVSSGTTTPNITLDFNELATAGTVSGSDDFVVVDGTSTRKEQMNTISLSGFSGYYGLLNSIYKNNGTGDSITPDSSGYMYFYEGTGIGLSFSGNSITFSSSTGSDYRLKKNISTFNSEAWTKVKGVNLRKFDFDEDAFKTAIASPDREITEEPKNYTDNIGFIAHELAEAGIQGSVIGDKDAVDEDGNFIYQKVNYIALVPVLWGALKEAISKIETLESKVQALEDK